MGSAAEAAYARLRKALLSWPRVRERPPKPGTRLAEASAKPPLRLDGVQLATFPRVGERLFHLAIRVPQGIAQEVPEAHPAPEGHLEAEYDLGNKTELARAKDVLRRVYQVHTGREPPP